jgi:hypothetical protein
MKFNFKFMLLQVNQMTHFLIQYQNDGREAVGTLESVS